MLKFEEWAKPRRTQNENNCPPSLILWLSPHSVSSPIVLVSALHPPMDFMAAKDGSSRQPESLGRVLMLTCSPLHQSFEPRKSKQGIKVGRPWITRPPCGLRTRTAMWSATQSHQVRWSWEEGPGVERWAYFLPPGAGSMAPRSSSGQWWVERAHGFISESFREMI